MFIWKSKYQNLTLNNQKSTSKKNVEIFGTLKHKTQFLKLESSKI